MAGSEYFELSPRLRAHLPTESTFDWLLNVSGDQVHRTVKNRRTVSFTVGGQRYFIKVHRGCGWREILKNLLQGKMPVTGAESEWRAIEELTRLGVPTMTLAGKGWRGRHPAQRESFVITEALENMISLAQLLERWGTMPYRQRVLLKRVLVRQLAATARVLHSAGLNHRDFYLVHFLVRDRDWAQWTIAEPVTAHLIDLHRVQIRRTVPWRWRVKDLAGLLFSALDAGLTQRDLWRFACEYRQSSIREVASRDARLWRAVWRGAGRLYRKFHGHPPTVRWWR